jgi:hypothetical protein
VSRGCLSDEVLREIDGLLPNLSVCEELVPSFSPDAISILFPPESTLPIVSVCLTDTLQTLFGVRYALHEYHAHSRWYRGKDPPDESAAVYFERYYLDDAAFRLYNAGEDLGSAIQHMLGVSTEELSGFREKATSLQATVGKYLKRKQPGEALTEAIESLRKEKDWKGLVEYRNMVVHEQAPTMEGVGLTYERRSRWKRDGGKYVLGIGGGDPPRLTTAVLGNTVQAATVAFIGVVEATARTYRGVLVNTGLVEFTDDGMNVTFRFGG